MTAASSRRYPSRRHTGGNHVLCDLQGGVYQRELVLSDPVILSRTREYGVTDLGPEGISSFFSQHACNDYCRPNWSKPFNPQQYFLPVPGSTMSGRYFGRDCLILETKYGNQCLRLSAWGRACGFVGANDSGGCGAPPEWSEEVQSAVFETLRRIAALLQDHRTLSRRYRLSRSEPPDATRSIMIGHNTLGSLARRLLAPAAERSGTGIQAAAQWAIVHKVKFAELVKYLKDFIDDLEDLTSHMVVLQRQRRFIQVEVESIYDESELEVIEQARIGRRDPVADAASLRLSQLHSASASNVPSSECTCKAATAEATDFCLNTCEPEFFGPSRHATSPRRQLLNK